MSVQKRNKATEELKKLEALKYNLTKLIVHDLRSPITSIMSAIDLFEQKRKRITEEDTDRFIAKIKKSCQVQLDLISDILEISRMENREIKLEKRKINIPSLIEDCLMQVEFTAAQKGLRIITKIQDSIPPMVADVMYVHRIIINLIQNSIKYTDRGGSVTIAVIFKKEDNNFLFRVKDTGLGVPKEYAHKIFDRFFQVRSSNKQARRGVGLGLSFCRMAVQAHGGTIWVDAAKGEGSSFCFTIPG